jgi:hypothetical protein
MLRIRKADGSVIPVPADGHFVELTSADGTIGMVFFQVPGMIIQVQPGSEDAQRYEQMFGKQGVKFNKVMVQRR